MMGSNKGRNDMPARRTRLIVQALQYAKVMDVGELTEWANKQVRETMKVYIDFGDLEKVSEGIKIMEEFKNDRKN